jgi:outer membrane protein assembly factor BamB
VYAGDYAGNVYSVNEANGRLNWEVNVGSPVSDSILVTDHTLIFGDNAGNVWGLNADTGATRWEVHPNTTSPYGAVFGSATMIGHNVAIGFASNEENVPGLTTYQENGSVALLNPANGQVIWQTYAIPQAAYNAGWRGVGIWSTPTYDQATHTIYVGTGNYYQAGTGTDPGVEDAVMAFDSRTGAVLWTDELVKGDIWNGNIVPGPNNPDADLGDSPKIFTLPSGETAVGIGSKDGFYFVMDAATGAPINGPNGLQLEVGGVLGGLFATGAVDQQDGIVFQNGVDWPTLGITPAPPVGGDLYAVSLDGKTVLWDFKTAAPNGSGVAIANGVVYFESLDGTLYALNAKAPDAAHALLGSFQIGGNYSGPAVADGHVFVGTGSIIPLAPYTQYQNSIVCLGLPPEAVNDLPGDLAAFGGAVTSANLVLAAGVTNNGTLNKSVNGVITALDGVVDDLAAIINVDDPSLTSLKTDMRAYFFAVAGNDTTGAQAALGNVETDLGAIMTALVTPMVNQARLGTDTATVFASLDMVLVDQQHHNLVATAKDSAAEFAALDAVFNDLLAGRYGVTL